MVAPKEKPPRVAGLSKLSSEHVEVDVVLGESDAGRPNNMAIDGSGATGVRAPDSLERR